MASVAHKFLRFGFVGVSVTVLCFGVYLVVVALGYSYIAGSVVAWGVGIFASYIANRTFTFRVAERSNPREVALYVIGYLLQIVAGTSSLALLIDGLGVDYRLAFCVNIPFTASISFLFMHFVVFRVREIGDNSTSKNENLTTRP